VLTLHAARCAEYETDDGERELAGMSPRSAALRGAKIKPMSPSAEGEAAAARGAFARGGPAGPRALAPGQQSPAVLLSLRVPSASEGVGAAFMAHSASLSSGMDMLGGLGDGAAVGNAQRNEPGQEDAAADGLEQSESRDLLVLPRSLSGALLHRCAWAHAPPPSPAREGCGWASRALPPPSQPAADCRAG
jgi:hypothetical protein